ncbi:nitroreductase family protein [Levilactobacillus tujiorum]|uniref:Nitroreductase family protein n=1 Tax=Levilactobacillus tujiorum TaxID=2912243 RepID=A0ABX1L2X4_9LACO|nr:nitroreductase family protein [Levilactobacillus tujiorum]MCH5463697.1 nitroreductase family protein [Levilactobacillus tujiorum]NLR10903.1 nitroreductase family protein [Lactobacillus sp. HBUAS51387]NLR28684.1 nitroreductase family protein [Levilactobacillus tujiorum]
METKFIELAKKRRSIYALGRKVDFSQDELVDLITSVIKQAPSPFNNQTTRAMILFGNSHEKLWDIVAAALRQVVKDDDAFAKTQAKINGFKAAYGTVLFFTETQTVKDFEQNFPLYADNFQDWSEQAQGNAQYAVWTALAENDLGANLQHYNPLIDDAVREAFDVPTSWRLRAEMDFGSIEAPAGDKDYLDDSERFRVFK